VGQVCRRARATETTGRPPVLGTGRDPSRVLSVARFARRVIDSLL